LGPDLLPHPHDLYTRLLFRTQQADFFFHFTF